MSGSAQCCSSWQQQTMKWSHVHELGSENYLGWTFGWWMEQLQSNYSHRQYPHWPSMFKRRHYFPMILDTISLHSALNSCSKMVNDLLPQLPVAEVENFTGSLPPIHNCFWTLPTEHKRNPIIFLLNLHHNVCWWRWYTGCRAMLYRVLILVMYAAWGCVCAIMVWVAGQARFPGPGQRETLITLWHHTDWGLMVFLETGEVERNCQGRKGGVRTVFLVGSLNP